MDRERLFEYCFCVISEAGGGLDEVDDRLPLSDFDMASGSW